MGVVNFNPLTPKIFNDNDPFFQVTDSSIEQGLLMTALGNLTPELCWRNMLHQDGMLVLFYPTGFELPYILFLCVYFMSLQERKNSVSGGARRGNSYNTVLHLTPETPEMFIWTESFGLCNLEELAFWKKKK